MNRSTHAFLALCLSAVATFVPFKALAAEPKTEPMDLPVRAESRQPGTICEPEPDAGPDAPVTLHVTGGTPADAEMACRALAKAFSFWQTNAPVGAPPPPKKVDVRFMDRLPVPGLALYEVATRTVLARQDMRATMSTHRLFGLPMTEELATSILVHEISHALTERLYSSLDGVGIEDEYAACVAQIDTLGGIERDQVRDRVARTPAPEERAFDTLSYEIHRQTFGVMAYRHFQSEGGGAAFLGRIFSRSFVAPRQGLF